MSKKQKKEAIKPAEPIKEAVKPEGQKMQPAKAEGQNVQPVKANGQKMQAVKSPEPTKEIVNSKGKKKQAVKPGDSKIVLAKAKEVVIPTKKIVTIVSDGAEVIEEQLIQPVVEAAKKEKPKKPRFVREKRQEKQSHVEIAPLARSTKVTSKLMTKGIVIPPKEDLPTNQKPKI